MPTLKPTSVGFPCVAENSIRPVKYFKLLNSKTTRSNHLAKLPEQTTGRMEYAFMGTLRERGYTRETHGGGFKGMG